MNNDCATSARCRRQSQPRGLGIIVFALLASLPSLTSAKHPEGGRYRCQPDDVALEALKPIPVNVSDPIGGPRSPTLDVGYEKNVGYTFLAANFILSRLTGGPGVSRGAIILPEKFVHPAAYAPYARKVALAGFFVVIANRPKAELVLRAMMLYPKGGIQFWSLIGHGRGADIAAELTLILEPKVKSLTILASPVPEATDFSDLNVFVTVAYGSADTVSTPAVITESFARVPGDARVASFDRAGHYDFAYSTCMGNSKVASMAKGGSYFARNATSAALIEQLLEFPLRLAHWASATPLALSFSNNSLLVPGDIGLGAKPYPPGSSLVRFSQLAIPGMWPKRNWFVFTPDKVKGGLVYYGGGAVDTRAYFPLAFQIATRGYLVVIVQAPGRFQSFSPFDALSVIQSKDLSFAQVPKGLWALAGHSLGGLTAGFYTSVYGRTIKALVLHASRISDDISNFSLPMITIDGSLDIFVGGITNRDPNRFKNYYTTPNGTRFIDSSKAVFVIIPGANHYQFGDYGYQVPHEVSTLSIQEQIAKVASLTADFLDQQLLPSS